MRSLLWVSILTVVGCGAAPKVEVDSRIKRNFVVSLAAERGELTAFIDGVQHMHAGTGRSATLSAQLREGEHTFLFAARPLEYEGMSFSVDVTTDGGRAFKLSCGEPCNEEALQATAETANGDRLLLSQRCADVEVKSVTGQTVKAADGTQRHELTVRLYVSPAQSAGKHAARGCK